MALLNTTDVFEEPVTNDYIEGVNTSEMAERLDESLEFGILLYIIIMALALAFAILSNLMIIYCVIRIQNLRTITNIFICNLSISDILLAAYVMPLKLHDISHYKKDWYEGQIHCRVVQCCPIFVISSSIYTLVCISFERRHVIMNSLKHGKHITYRRLALVIVLIWTFAAVIASPTLFEYTVYEKTIVSQDHSRTLMSCGSSFSRVLALANAIFVSVVSYVIPVILMTKNYSQLARYVWRKGKWIRDNLGHNVLNTSSVRLFKQRIKIVKLLILVAVIFAVSWLPFFAVLFYAKVTGTDASEDAAGFSNLLLLALATFSTAYNVILYVIFNRSFRQAILGVLRCTGTSEVNSRVKLSDSPHSPQEDNGVDNLAAASDISIKIVANKPEFSVLDQGV